MSLCKGTFELHDILVKPIEEVMPGVYISEDCGGTALKGPIEGGLRVHTATIFLGYTQRHPRAAKERRYASTFFNTDGPSWRGYHATIKGAQAWLADEARGLTTAELAKREKGRYPAMRPVCHCATCEPVVARYVIEHGV